VKFSCPGLIVPYTRTTQGSKWNARSRRYFASKENLALSVKLQMRRCGNKRLPDKTPFLLRAHFTRRNFLTCDLDNLAKAVADALNGIAYDDDRYCVRLEATKRRGPDFAEIEILEAGDDN